jgi:hypothetical protein
MNLLKKYSNIPITQDALQVNVTLAAEEQKQEPRYPGVR